VKSFIKHLVAAIFATILIVQPVAAMTVQPVVINLQTGGRGMTQVITVENTFAAPLPVELRIQELTLDEDGVKSILAICWFFHRKR